MESDISSIQQSRGKWSEWVSERFTNYIKLCNYIKWFNSICSIRCNCRKYQQRTSCSVLWPIVCYFTSLQTDLCYIRRNWGELAYRLTLKRSGESSQIMTQLLFVFYFKLKSMLSAHSVLQDDSQPSCNYIVSKTGVSNQSSQGNEATWM